ncbi:MAG: asparagine synthase (glutamine-hydrolyzing), partial [Nanoarchaeota archaeon]|nr:asparagine synthase (glutamine-hydrolyzing) [Nanoarchaeota archaeon]
MCGICGFTWEDKEILKQMMRSISHRGPDQNGTFFEKGVSLGHLRLSIIDLSPAGKQPMFNEDGDICVVFNGEIYNYRELRTELEKKGHRFASQTDTEVIVHAYEEYGEKCVEKFNGMFAFAIWDSKKKRLFLARDRLGVKPLYYHFKNGQLIFASEMKALLQHEIARKMNSSCLQQLIAYAYPVNGDTLLEGIVELLPGHTLTFSNGKIDLRKYWDLEVRETNFSEKQYVDTLRSLLEASVNRRLISDVPLGLTLSGGLDSSMLVALAS